MVSLRFLSHTGLELCVVRPYLGHVECMFEVGQQLTWVLFYSNISSETKHASLFHNEPVQLLLGSN
jgi:hypothetical protein